MTPFVAAGLMRCVDGMRTCVEVGDMGGVPGDLSKTWTLAPPNPKLLMAA